MPCRAQRLVCSSVSPPQSPRKLSTKERHSAQADKRPSPEHDAIAFVIGKGIRHDLARAGLARFPVPAGTGPARDVDPYALFEMAAGRIGDDDHRCQRHQHAEKQQQDLTARPRSRIASRQQDVAEPPWCQEAAVVAYMADRDIVAHVMFVPLVKERPRPRRLWLRRLPRRAPRETFPRLRFIRRPRPPRRFWTGPGSSSPQPCWRRYIRCLKRSRHSPCVVSGRTGRAPAARPGKGSRAYPAARQRHAEQFYVLAAAPWASKDGFTFSFKNCLEINRWRIFRPFRHPAAPDSQYCALQGAQPPTQFSPRI